MSSAKRVFSGRPNLSYRQGSRSPSWTCFFCQQARSTTRFSTSARARQEQRRDSGPFRTRVRTVLRDTKVQWKPIPVGLGIGFLGAFQFYRVRAKEKRRQQEEKYALETGETHSDGGERTGRPKKRKRIRPSGPWYLYRGRTGRSLC